MSLTNILKTYRITTFRIGARLILPMLFLACTTNKEGPKHGYYYSVDLRELKGDQLAVELEFTGPLPDTAYFYLPKIVPGIYGELNFGKVVSNLRATDESGNALTVHRLDDNTWQILGASSLERIRYSIDDGWEDFDFEDIRPYRSSESHFDKEAYILNTNTVFGYFGGHKNLPFELHIQKDSATYGATSLDALRTAKHEDIFRAVDYRNLVDNPIMYAPADTAFIELENIRVQVAAYSTSGEPIADDLAEHIAPLVKNQSEYLDGNLATDTYSFLVYHNENPDGGEYFADGLEHNESTVILIYSPLDREILKSIIFHLASHEFFHTLLPLGLHSEEIADYDFNDPEFSKHLWLYEGTTEYFTIHMRIAQKLETLETFLGEIEDKISGMQEFDNAISFTTLSQNVAKMPESYMNVYLKGALINLCLDIRLRELSNGKYGIKALVFDLMEQYGRDKPFRDDELFAEMVRVSGYPELRTFIARYIEGTQELPLKESLEKVGLHYDAASGQITEDPSPSDSQLRLRRQWLEW